MLETLFADLQDRLAAAVPDLKYVDFNWGQMDDEQPPVKFPCALFDLRACNFTDKGNGEQVGIADIEIAVFDLNTTNSSAAAPANQKATAMRALLLCNAIQSALHKWAKQPEAANPYGQLTRISVTRLRRRDRIRQYNIVYRVQLNDVSGDHPLPTVKFGIV